MDHSYRKLLVYATALGAALMVIASAESSATGWTFGPGEAMPVALAPGQPFSAVLTSQVTPNGQVSVSQPRSYKFYRDSAGRTMSTPAFEAGGYNSSVTEVDDPVAGSWYVFDARTQIAHESKRPVRASATPSSSAPTASGQKTLDMGARIMLGVQATGNITTAADGSWSVERWWCSDLNLVMLMRSVNRFGGGVNEITSLQLGDPPSEYFQVPSGYAIVSEPGPFTLPN